MNLLYFVVPYQSSDAPNIWVFDDDLRGFFGEPFGGDANTVLDYAAEKLKATDRLILFFTVEKSRLPSEWFHNIDADLVLKQRDDAAGSIYDVRFSDGKCFPDVRLCPALLTYFPELPEHFTTMVTPYENRHKIMDETTRA